MLTAEFYIKQLNLLPHPEGGYYKETYRSEKEVSVEGFEGSRNVSTAIYFLLKDTEKSHLHRIKSDEIWFFHQGEALEVLVLHNNVCAIYTLGKQLDKGELYQLVVPAGAWFGARVKNGFDFALVSCTVAPGFDFADFELAEYKKISREFPAYKSILKEMCIK
jgi:predicted cupin superfamily sugar epimerase